MEETAVDPLQARISELIAQVKGDETLSKRLDSRSNLVEDIGLDSLQMINLLLLVESDVGVEVEFESFSIDHLRSLSAFTRYIKGLKLA